jgi:EAL domain-containing protein (putative c-di-GMP-specific phosphodiesterase class I)
VVAQLAFWQSDGSPMVVSLNVSVRDLHSTKFVTWLDARMRHYGVDPSRLIVELTETALLNQTSLILDATKALSRLGVGVSLDDFGTGFSSLQHLRQLPLTEIKIDKSFVQSMTGHRKEAAIVRAVIDFGRELGLRVVAEGVEDSQTREALLDAGCRVAQGWYYAKPMPADEFTERYLRMATGTPSSMASQPRS